MLKTVSFTAVTLPKPSNDGPAKDLVAEDAAVHYRILAHRFSFSLQLNQKYKARVEDAKLRIRGKEVDFSQVRHIRRGRTVTYVTLDNASMQVKHREVRGKLTFAVDGIKGTMTMPWSRIDDLQRISSH